MNLNRVTIAGRLTRDSEIKYTTTGKAVVNMCVAVNRQWKTEAGEKRDDVTFIDVTMWGPVGESFCKFHTKASSVFIDGRLNLETWDDKTTGKKRTKLIVIGESWQFVESKPQGERAPAAPSAPASRKSPIPADVDNLNGPAVEEDDVPF